MKTNLANDLPIKRGNQLVFAGYHGPVEARFVIFLEKEGTRITLVD
jgi:hypothetical protein